MSDPKKSVGYSSKCGIAGLGQRSWAKKLEAVSGKPIAPIQAGGTIFLAVDCSGSMSDGDKIGSAKKGASGFADESQRKGYSVGLIQFSSYAEHISDPVNEIASLNAEVEKLEIGGSTNMADAISLATNKLADKMGEKIICLVTDGMPDNRHAAFDAAHRAKKEQIDIMAIGTDDADKNFLEEIVTRKELSVKVSREQLEQGIVSMAKLLP